MFGTIRRHQSWLLLVIASLTIVSFIYFFNPQNRYAGRGAGSFSSANYGEIDHEPITQDAYNAAEQDARLYYFLNHGTWPDRDADAKRQGFDLQRETYMRLLLAQKAKESGIEIGQEALQRAAAELVLSAQTRNNQISTLDDFTKQYLQPEGLTTGDLRNYLESSLTIRALSEEMGQGGQYTTPQEAEMLYRRENEQISTEAVVFSASNYLAQVTASPDILGAFFTNQMARYRLPDRVQVSYIKFPEQDFLSDADATIAQNTNFDLQVDAIYEQRGSNYFGAVTPAEAKVKIRKEVREETALQDARKMAAAFADTLEDITPVQPDNLASMAAKSNLTVAVTAPFDAQSGPAELNVPAEFANYAFKLTPDDPFAGPIVGDDAVYVIAFKQMIPSEIPPYDSIRAKVADDYKLLMAIQLARQAGTNFAATANSTAAKGKTFASLAAADNLSVLKLPPFSLSTRSLPEIEGHITFGRLEDVAYGLPTGYVSSFVPTAEGGLLLHVVARTQASDATVKEALPAFLAQLRQTRENEAFQTWLGQAYQSGMSDTPLAQKQQQQ